MPLNSELIARRVIGQLDDIGIRSKVGGKDSETAQLVRIIVAEVIRAIQAEAVVTVTVQTTGSPTNHVGTGTGKIT